MYHVLWGGKEEMNVMQELQGRSCVAERGKAIQIPTTSSYSFHTEHALHTVLWNKATDYDNVAKTW